eukprot:INCI18048.1.p1 GENE.INCI18048.1~~INCI18048.1.p1  ORF type:complete len:436 (-),score=84.22 INCI18048.1:545-1741(-)
MAREARPGLSALVPLVFWVLQLFSVEPILGLSERQASSARATLLELREAQAELRLLESRVAEQREVIQRLEWKFAEESLVELGVDNGLGDDALKSMMIVALLEAVDMHGHDTPPQEEGDVLENTAAIPMEVPLSLTDQRSDLFVDIVEGPRDLSEGIRKKDSPDNIAQLLEHLRVQKMQDDLRSARLPRSGERARVVLLPPLQQLLPNEMFMGAEVANEVTYRWNVTCGPALYEANWYGAIDHCTPAWVGARDTTKDSPPLELAGSDTYAGRCERVAVDAFANRQECEFVVAATKRAFVGLFHQGGATSLVPDASSRDRLGKVGFEFIQSLRNRAKAKLKELFGIKHLFDSGALLTRLTADYQNDEWDMDPNHKYWNAHIDKANIASYDYSALLYLSG